VIVPNCVNLLGDYFYINADQKKPEPTSTFHLTWIIHINISCLLNGPIKLLLEMYFLRDKAKQHLKIS
jgi:hypothetical protein